MCPPGVATTFINKNVDESILLDLKHLLIEAKQRIPPVPSPHTAAAPAPAAAAARQQHQHQHQHQLQQH